jgi:hypothetical protein
MSKLTDEKEAEIDAAARAGKSVAEICRECEVSAKAVMPRVWKIRKSIRCGTRDCKRTCARKCFLHKDMQG